MATGEVKLASSCCCAAAAETDAAASTSQTRSTCRIGAASKLATAHLQLLFHNATSASCPPPSTSDRVAVVAALMIRVTSVSLIVCLESRGVDGHNAANGRVHQRSRDQSLIGWL